MKPKIIIAIAMATLMVLLAFSSVIGEQQNSSNVSGTQTLNNVSVGKAIKTQALTIQELQALQEFEVYNILNYGIHSNNLSKLEYKANLNFISWYWTNYTHIPSPIGKLVSKMLVLFFLYGKTTAQKQKLISPE